MRNHRVKVLRELNEKGFYSKRIDLEIEKEIKRIKSDFKVWKTQLNNFFLYIDRFPENKEKERELFLKEVDPIEAGEILIKS